MCKMKFHFSTIITSAFDASPLQTLAHHQIGANKNQLVFSHTFAHTFLPLLIASSRLPVRFFISTVLQNYWYQQTCSSRQAAEKTVIRKRHRYSMLHHFTCVSITKSSPSPSKHVPGSQYIVMESIVMLDSEDVLEKNEIVELIKVEANSCLCVRSADGTEGLVPSSFVRRQLDAVGSMEGEWLAKYVVVMVHFK